MYNSIYEKPPTCTTKPQKMCCNQCVNNEWGFLCPKFKRYNISKHFITEIDTKNPILISNPYRFVIFPIQHNQAWDFYKKAVASFWTPEEITLTEDKRDWSELSHNTKQFLLKVLAFFAASDGIINENLAQTFHNEVQIPEIRAFYGFQIAIENIHSETYSLLIDSFITDNVEKEKLFKAIDTIPSIRNKANWALNWINHDRSFPERLLAFACVEGIFFSASFCAIFWIKKSGKLLNLGFSNELISRDEGLHTDFACMLYNNLPTKLPPCVVYKIFDEAVQAEVEFVKDALAIDLIGMNVKSMTKYIKFIADRLLKSINYKPLYGEVNPYDWMDLISMQRKTNFFEGRVAEYQRAGILCESTKHNVFSIDEDF